MSDFVRQLSDEQEVFNRDNVRAVIVWVQVETGPRSGRRGFMCRISVYGIHRQTGEVWETAKEAEDEAKELAKKAIVELEEKSPLVKVSKASLEACEDYRYKIVDLLVRSVNHMPINRSNLEASKSSLACAICDGLLSIWKNDGCVSLVEMDLLVRSSVESLAFTSRDVKPEEVKEVLEAWAQEGIVRFELGWLIPQSTLLQCASHEDVEPGTAWNCLVGGYFHKLIVLV